MLDRQQLESILGIDAPWELRDIRWLPEQRRCDIWIGKRLSPREWLAMRREPALPEKVWRHLNVIGMQTWLHVTPPLDAELENLSWTGSEEHCFTHAMARHLFTLMTGGMPLATLCRILDIDIADLWRYCDALHRRRQPIGNAAPGS
ncbi:MAG: hypothetical protein EPN72_07050 [Nevskiaceae bacterium]|nr:MAG: hypothetical protein EPN63_10750 [Nevskiaceae bacterium]TBR73252.1 MAG: hypothetical protein EPN72_07050 [Nevskiaceae bacterium]